MNAIDELFYQTLGWTWVAEYATILFIAAAALLLILLITIIAVAVHNSKHKKRVRKMQAEIDAEKVQNKLHDEGAYRAEVRAEIEPIIRAELEKEYANKPVNDKAAHAKIEQLNATIKEKDSHISELGSALVQANSAHKTDNTELYRTINDINQDKRRLQNDVNILRAENAQLKAQAQQAAREQAAREQTAREQESAPSPAPAQRKVETEKTAAKKTAPAKRKTEKTEAAEKPVVKRTAPVKQPEPEPEPDDEEDEYYDDYGDASSAIKVTLKYDRVKANWVIYRSDVTRAYRRLATKQESLDVAKDLARRLNAQLVVHKKDGKFQKI